MTLQWLDVEHHGDVEVTSQDPEHPIESALRVEKLAAWHAADPGPQTVRLRFDEPQRLRRIRLLFEEHTVARTQEFLLRWSRDNGATYGDIVRQQYTFSPPETVREVEEYSVQLDGVTSLELCITPQISGAGVRASLAEWLVA